MFELDFSKYLLGIDQEDLTALQMTARAVIVYISTIAMIRIGEQRVLGKNTAFDVILGVVLGSSLSRAINGGADLTPTIAAGFALIALHWIFAAIAFRAGWFGRLVKGRPMTLIREGKYMHKNLSRAHITQRDLEEASRRQVGLEDPGSAKLVSLERSGEMSFVLRDDEEDRGEISEIDVDVKDGVKTVRIVLA